MKAVKFSTVFGIIKLLVFGAVIGLYAAKLFGGFTDFDVETLGMGLGAAGVALLKFIHVV